MYDDNKGIEKEMELAEKAKGVKREPPREWTREDWIINIALSLIFFGGIGGILYVVFAYVIP